MSLFFVCNHLCKLLHTRCKSQLFCIFSYIWPGPYQLTLNIFYILCASQGYCMCRLKNIILIIINE